VGMMSEKAVSKGDGSGLKTALKLLLKYAMKFPQYLFEIVPFYKFKNIIFGGSNKLT
jgi:hypothetical protein